MKDSKLIVVILSSALILLGIFLYLVNIDKKISKIERDNSAE
jgi:hypothetical protein